MPITNPVALSALDSGAAERREPRTPAEPEALPPPEALDFFPEPVWVTDPLTHEILYLNRAARALFGEAAGRPCYRVLQQRSQPCDQCWQGTLFGEARPSESEQRREHFNAHLRRWFHCVAKPARWPDGRVVRSELAADITEARREDIARRAQVEDRMRHRLRVEEAIALVSRHFVSFVETDLGEVLHILGETVGACRAYVFRFGCGLTRMSNTDEWTRPGVSRQRDNLQGLETAQTPWWMRLLRGGCDIVIPDVAALPAEAAAERAILETQDIRAAVVVPIHAQTGELTGFLGFDDTRAPRPWVAEDVRALRLVGEMVAILWERRATAERLRQAEAQLVHAQKMEAVGRLAGGVAHDFNNLLTAITAHTEFALEALGEPDVVAEELGEVHANAARATELTRQLLAFGRRPPGTPGAVDLNQIVCGLERMLRRVLGADVNLRTVPTDGLWPVLVDAGQLEQVVVNLAVNARDAMSDGGTLVIRTANVEVDEHVAALDGDVAPGAYVVLSVSDTGCGMTDQVKARVFEPFFSTKDGTKGTGLGLAMVYGTVTQSGGAIHVRSTPGQGSTFDLYFPRAGGVPDRDAARPAAAPLVRGGRETLLLVEDEDPVRNLAARALRRLGYQVLEARDGSAALELCAAHATPVDLLVSDVVMPRMGGVELATRIRDRWPGVPVVFVSGYTEDALTRAAALGIDADYVQKPFRLAVLGEAVRRALDARVALGAGGPGAR